MFLSRALALSRLYSWPQHWCRHINIDACSVWFDTFTKKQWNIGGAWDGEGSHSVDLMLSFPPSSLPLALSLALSPSLSLPLPLSLSPPCHCKAPLTLRLQLCSAQAGISTDEKYFIFHQKLPSLYVSPSLWLAQPHAHHACYSTETTTTSKDIGTQVNTTTWVNHWTHTLLLYLTTSA